MGMMSSVGGPRGLTVPSSAPAAPRSGSDASVIVVYNERMLFSELLKLDKRDHIREIGFH